jgi:hypothetical protein
MAEIKQQFFSLKEAAAVLVKAQGYSEGYFELTIEFNVGIGNLGPNAESVAPSAIIGVQRIGLSEVPNPTANSVDAALVNPKGKKKSIPPKKK